MRECTHSPTPKPRIEVLAPGLQVGNVARDSFQVILECAQEVL